MPIPIFKKLIFTECVVITVYHEWYVLLFHITSRKLRPREVYPRTQSPAVGLWGVY